MERKQRLRLLTYLLTVWLIYFVFSFSVPEWLTICFEFHKYHGKNRIEINRRRMKVKWNIYISISIENEKKFHHHHQHWSGGGKLNLFFSLIFSSVQIKQFFFRLSHNVKVRIFSSWATTVSECIYFDINNNNKK